MYVFLSEPGSDYFRNIIGLDPSPEQVLLIKYVLNPRAKMKPN